MQKILWTVGWMAVVAVAVFGCEDSGGETEGRVESRAAAARRAPLGEGFALPIASTALAGPEELAIGFESVVEDSRCEGAECADGGNAAARFGVEGEGGALATIILNTGRPPREVTIMDHVVRLVELSQPLLAAASPDSGAYVATLIVERTGS